MQYYHNIEACKNCPNNPTNGGSGMCSCTIPYMTPTNPDLTTYDDTIGLPKKEG